MESKNKLMNGFLTVALIEGANLASTGPSEVPDPYVVFTCNGKSRTSSVKLQTLDPHGTVYKLFLGLFSLFRFPNRDIT